MKLAESEAQQNYPPAPANRGPGDMILKVFSGTGLLSRCLTAERPIMAWQPRCSRCLPNRDSPGSLLLPFDFERDLRQLNY